MTHLPHVYPVASPADGAGDTRYTWGLLTDVLGVLTRHGYPGEYYGADVVALSVALFDFVYRDRDTGDRAYADCVLCDDASNPFTGNTFLSTNRNRTHPKEITK